MTAAPRTAAVAASDGCLLATDICLPAGAHGSGPFPAVLLRTPYDRRAHLAELRAWADRGFAAAAQDVRGRHGSAGSWHPYRNEAADGAAAARWVRRQPWNDGTVVAVGASYAAHCALAPTLAVGTGTGTGTGTEEDDGLPDAVIAAVPALGLAETAREPGGPERLYSRAGWWAAHGDRSDSDEEALRTALAADPLLLEHLPLAGLPRRLGRDLPSWSGLWRDHGHGRLPDRAPTARMPLLAVGGSHDAFADDTLRLWRRWGGTNARLLLGPWGHGLTSDPGPDAQPQHRLRGGLGELYVRWARAALAGRLAPGRTGAVALGGSPAWLPAARLDPPGVRLEFGAADGLRLLHGAEFTADPSRPAASDSLTIPRMGEPDRCVLATGPLPEPMDLFGTAEIRLRAAAGTAHADWVARLVLLTGSGDAEALGVCALRTRGEPGRAAGHRLRIGPLARRIPAGARLRLELAGHHFPAHARQPHTGADPVTATDLRCSRRTVHPAGSALLLPVLAPGPSPNPSPNPSPGSPPSRPPETEPLDPVQEILR
ncbi:CocE/NonD family hydrolase [Streptomyces sp. N2-109]|uniref:CocE/NonD family hydrolase n=1 Tax=Streptomyces gossypii TaxID=2883101 RepID=A0ABT2JZY4_9ACTN|nr:CocE/NonD family hydrolase [Streptomyces gossypii]MCT2593481.1 CocE/NonD family hydrolase [Streptomyces gossypii]